MTATEAGTTASRPRPPRPPSPARRGVLAAAAAAIALFSGAVGYVAGRTAEPSGRPRPTARAEDGVERLPAATPGAARATAAPAPGPAPALAPTSTASTERPSSAEQIRERVTAQAAAELDRIRPQLVERCWNALRSRPPVRSATVLLAITFDAQGREVGRAIVEDRGDEAAIAPVAECLRGVGDLPLSVQPAGTSIAVEVPLTVP